MKNKLFKDMIVLLMIPVTFLTAFSAVAQAPHAVRVCQSGQGREVYQSGKKGFDFGVLIVNCKYGDGSFLRPYPGEVRGSIGVILPPIFWGDTKKIFLSNTLIALPKGAQIYGELVLK